MLRAVHLPYGPPIILGFPSSLLVFVSVVPVSGIYTLHRLFTSESLIYLTSFCVRLDTGIML